MIDPLWTVSSLTFVIYGFLRCPVGDSVGSARLIGHPPDLRRGRRGSQPLASKDAVLVSIMGGQRDSLVGPQLGNVTGKVGRQKKENCMDWNT